MKKQTNKSIDSALTEENMRSQPYTIVIDNLHNNVLNIHDQKIHDLGYSRKIHQYDKNGAFIKEWDSLTQIYNELGITCDLISRCCHGHNATSFNYIWKYK